MVGSTVSPCAEPNWFSLRGAGRTHMPRAEPGEDAPELGTGRLLACLDRHLFSFFFPISGSYCNWFLKLKLFLREVKQDLLKFLHLL